MDFKSTKLTNILLLIITSILVLALLWAVCKGVKYHKGFDGYKIQWEHTKCGMGMGLEKWEHSDNCENEDCLKHTELEE